MSVIFLPYEFQLKTIENIGSTFIGIGSNNLRTYDISNFRFDYYTTLRINDILNETKEKEIVNWARDGF